MTREDVIIWLEYLSNDARSKADGLVPTNIEIACGMAIDALKAQEPVEPKVDVDEWRCGNCGHKLEHQELLSENVLFHEQYSYCPQCGKAVKWE